jgi:uncharacterized protein YbaR (Trm112 family)
MLAPELLNILVCPVCKGQLHPDEIRSTLDCPACALAYPVRGGIPVMLPGEAEPLGGRGNGAAGS